nr:TPR repeat containing protein YDR161W [Hymenolepis microstoma]
MPKSLKKFKVHGVGSRALQLEKLSPKEILKKADVCYENLNSDQALKLYGMVIEKVTKLPSTDDNNAVMVDALQSSANILVQFERVDEAISHFKRAIEICPDSGYEKYMSLAQLLGGEEAVNLYQRGIGIINDILKSFDSNDSTGLRSLKRDLSIAHCAIAEVYLVDLWNDPSGPAMVQQEVDKAIEIDEHNPQAWYIKASCLFLTGHLDDAKGAMEKCLSLFWPEIQRIFDERWVGDKTYEEEIEDEEKLAADLVELSGMPPEKHFEMALLLRELGMYGQAEKILGLLHEFDDTNPDVLFQLALVANQLYSETETHIVRLYVNSALEACAHSPAMVSELTTILSALPVESEVESEDADDEELETDSDEGNMEIE